MKHTIKITALIVAVATIFTACKKDKVAANVKKFNVTRFRDNLKTQIAVSSATQAQGYSFVITKDGLIADSFSLGTAYRTAAGGGTAALWHTNQEINIASVSKTLTAVAVFQLLKKNNLSITDKIGTWLPNYFNAATAVKNLTFEELMTHSSGLLESNTSYDSIRATVKRGLDDPSKPKDNYANINFALFRIMIPFLRDKSAAALQESTMLPANPSGFESWLSSSYIGYMQINVFTPIGLGTVNCKPSANTAQAFSEPAGPGQAVANLTDWTESCGGGGYFMSVNEMARFMVYISQTYTILDGDQRALMDSKFMGWDNEDSPNTIAGRAYGKDGALRWDSNGNGVAPDPGDAGLQTLVMKFPNKVELALAINSLPGNWRSLSSMALSAYNNAWED